MIVSAGRELPNWFIHRSGYKCVVCYLKLRQPSTWSKALQKGFENDLFIVSTKDIRRINVYNLILWIAQCAFKLLDIILIILLKHFAKLLQFTQKYIFSLLFSLFVFWFWLLLFKYYRFKHLFNVGPYQAKVFTVTINYIINTMLAVC